MMIAEGCKGLRRLDGLVVGVGGRAKQGERRRQIAGVEDGDGDAKDGERVRERLGELGVLGARGSGRG